MPLGQIASAEVDHDPIHSIRRFSAVKGRKVIPGLDPFCVCYLDQGRQFFAVKGGRDALAVNVEGLKLKRLTVTFPDPVLMVERIAAAKGAPDAPSGSYLSASSIANIAAKRPIAASASLKVSAPRRPVAAV